MLFTGYRAKWWYDIAIFFDYHGSFEIRQATMEEVGIIQKESAGKYTRYAKHKKFLHSIVMSRQ